MKSAKVLKKCADNIDCNINRKEKIMFIGSGQYNPYNVGCNSGCPYNVGSKKDVGCPYNVNTGCPYNVNKDDDRKVPSNIKESCSEYPEVANEAFNKLEQDMINFLDKLNKAHKNSIEKNPDGLRAFFSNNPNYNNKTFSVKKYLDNNEYTFSMILSNFNVNNGFIVCDYICDFSYD